MKEPHSEIDGVQILLRPVKLIHSIEKAMAFFSSPTLIKFAILIAAMAVISVASYLKKRNAETRSEKFSNFILVCLGALALLSYINFKPFSAQPNHWDMFHYYVGSKYFPEIGYTRLYACVVRAEAENDDPSVKTQAYRRTIRNLETNDLVPARTYFFDDTFCKARFSASRWNEFKNDVGFFRTRLAEGLWDLAQIDHGFNPSPVWILAGGFISGLVPLSDAALTGMVLIDVFLLFGCAACLFWAFGLPTAAFAVIASTVSGGVDWSWVGGGMLRLDWLFMAVLSVCAMKRGHYALAGAALGYAATLRVFPAVFALGPFVGLLHAIYTRQHDLKVAYGKFFGGMVVSAAVLVASATAAYGGDSLRAFLDNTRKHSAVISTNNVGLRTILTYSPDTAVRKTVDAGVDEPFIYWKWEKAKTEAKQKVVPVYVVIVAISLLFFVPAVISGGAWQSIALGATFVPFTWSELSNYYYMFLMVVATLFAANRKVAFPLLAIGMVTETGKLFEIDIDKIFILFSEQHISNVNGTVPGIGLDEIYTIFSAAVCIGFIFVWWQVNSRALSCRKILLLFTKGKDTAA